MTETKSSGSWIWILVVLLIIVHQDNYLWNNGYLVFGFIPIGLFFHAGISMAAAMTWFLATKYAWPTELEFAPEVEPATDSKENAE